MNHFDFAASRAYFTMFYIAEALLAAIGQSYSKHSAVISAFGREYAKTGKLDSKFHRMLIDAQDFRNIGDYGIEAHVSEDDAKLICDWLKILSNLQNGELSHNPDYSFHYHMLCFFE